MSADTINLRRCKNKACNEYFTPVRKMQAVCCHGCAISLSRYKAAAKVAKAQKVERAADKVKLENLQPKSYWLKRAQTAFNAFIRERDRELPCISCGRHHEGQYHAGHYRSVGAMASLRFHEWNVHKQCAPCNNHKSGNVLEYRIRLIPRIGADNVAWLEKDHPVLKQTIPEIQAIEKMYKDKLKALLAERELTMEAA